MCYNAPTVVRAVERESLVESLPDVCSKDCLCEGIGAVRRLEPAAKMRIVR
jgi:hypothetical protein